MSALWVPTDTDYRRRLTELPMGDVTMPNGGVLRRFDRWTPTEHCQGARYKGPGGLVVIATLDSTERHGNLLHISMSYADRDPTWTTIKQVRAAFFPPDVDVMMVMPREADYVNVQEHCFHLWQTPSAWGMR